MSAIHSDNYIRLMLDGAPTAAFDGLFMQAIEADVPLTPFQCLDRRVPIALDGTEHFCSRKIKCAQCSTRRRATAARNTSTPSWVPAWWHPATSRSCHCRRSSSRRRTEPRSRIANATLRNAGWPGMALAIAHLQPIYLGDDLFACQPIVAAIHDAGGNFILTCKSTSHQTVAEYLHGAELQEHRQAVCKRGKRTTTIYRWLNAVPLRGTDDAILVNWFSIEILTKTLPSVLLNHDLAEVGKIIHDLVPFRYGEMAGYQPVHQFLAQHQGEKGAEDVAADGRIGSMKDRPCGQQRLSPTSQLAVKHPSNGRISGGVVPQGRHHRMDGDYAIGMPSVVILGGGWSGKLILSR